jgi:hypothetical protein
MDEAAWITAFGRNWRIHKDKSQSYRCLGDKGAIEQFYVDANARDNFDKLKTEVEYKSTREVYRDAEVDSEGEANVKMRAKLTRLVTHEPGRWSCTIWYAPYSGLNP